MENQQSFWQFSDQLRLQNSNFANLSLNDSIWSNNYVPKRQDERMNFEVNSEVNSWNSKVPSFNSKPSFSNDFSNGFNYGWKIGSTESRSDLNAFDDGWKKMGPNGSGFGAGLQKNMNNMSLNEGFNKGGFGFSKNLNGLYNGNNNINNNGNFGVGLKNKAEDVIGGKNGKKNGYGNRRNSGGEINNVDEKEGKTGNDKKFKTLPPSESLPRNEPVGGYIFVCNNDTMQENLQRQLFGLPPRYRDSVRQITPGLPLFLYNYSTHQLHGIFEAASFGGSNIDPTAWEDKKCPGESRFPAQVQVMTRKVCEPLEEDAFRPILHHYDGPKFRLELSVPEALSLLDIFADQDSNITGILEDFDGNY